jgi:hypothetical protein
MFEFLAKIVAEQWAAVMQNPAILLPVFALGLVCGWGAAWLILQQRLKHHRDVIVDLRARLGDQQPAFREKRKLVREKLGEFLEEGHELLNRCHDISQPAPDTLNGTNE